LVSRYLTNDLICRYLDSTKACKSGGLRVTGKMLSNTLITCPMVRDNLGKLRVIPDRRSILGCSFSEIRAIG